MNRDAMKYLESWKDRAKPEPLMIRGARQVGKTWLMKEFGKKSYEKTAYINFDGNERMHVLFSGDFSIDRIVEGLSLESNVDIEPDNTLIILDEIQEEKNAISCLKYFAEDSRPFHVVCAGSLLGISLHGGFSFPVGKVDHLDLYPMSFVEFLSATGNERLRSLIERRDYEMIRVNRDRFTGLLKAYYFIGGMPQAVSEYITTRNYDAVRHIHNNILSDYENDFSKHAPNSDVPKIRLVWKSIISQLAKENRKFLYSLLKTGSRAKEYENAIQLLSDAGLVIKVPRIKKPGIPLSAYEDLSAFKMYFVDTGLLGAKADLSAKTILEGSSLFTEFKGALTEQFVCQQLKSMDLDVYYWSADNSQAEIDFIFSLEDRIFPVEVKAEENLKARSLRAFLDRFGMEKGIRLSLSDYRQQEWLTNYPLYTVSSLIQGLTVQLSE